MSTDPIADLRSVDPVDAERLRSSWSSSEAEQALFQEIMTMITSTRTTTPTTGRTTRPPRRALVLAAALVALSLATLAGAATLLRAEDTVDVACRLPDGGVAVSRATTGDPVEDCAVEWERATGEESPALQAWITDRGGIEVVPSGDDVPQGWEPLEPGVVQEPSVLELQSALEDAADGLASRCLDLGAGTEVARRELERLGLGDWTVRRDREDADGCATAIVQPARRTVVVVPVEGRVDVDGGPHAAFAGRLADELRDRCLDLDAAADLARRLAAETGVPGGDAMDVVTLEDPDAGCTRVDVVVGGMIVVTLRGPVA